MSQNSKIEWTDATWNPIRAQRKEPIQRPDPADDRLAILVTPWGYHCEPISPGCKNCYAEAMNARMLPAWGTGLAYSAANTERVEMYLDETVLALPLKRRKPQTIFPCSMTDAFGHWVLDEWLDKMFAVATLTPHITYLFLTKRSDRLPRYLGNGERHTPIISAMNTLGVNAAAIRWPLPNVRIGVSVENQDWADLRREHLKAVAAQGWRTFVSYEPALGPVDWTGWEFLNWGIFGGESGHGARECNIAWARSAVGQWRAAGTLPFVKQLGSKSVETIKKEVFGADDGRACVKSWTTPLYLEDNKGGEISEFPLDLRVREFPVARTALLAPTAGGSPTSTKEATGSTPQDEG